MKKALISMLLVVLALLMVSCSSSPIVGEWKETEHGYVIEFKGNGNLILNKDSSREEKGTYTIDEEEEIIKMISDDGENVLECPYILVNKDYLKLKQEFVDFSDWSTYWEWTEFERVK